jgi:hypothetical protein
VDAGVFDDTGRNQGGYFDTQVMCLDPIVVEGKLESQIERTEATWSGEFAFDVILWVAAARKCMEP